MPAPDLTPRKHPRQSRGKATVASILEAAARILEERGLEGFNTNAVAERAGVGIGSLYQYFPNKDALVAALSRAHAERLLAAIGDAAARTAGEALDARLAAFARVAVAQQLERPKLARLLDMEEARLALDGDALGTGPAIRDHLRAVLARDFPDTRDVPLETVAADILYIARGLIDGAAQAGLPKPAALEARVLAAVRGYLRETVGWSPR